MKSGASATDAYFKITRCSRYMQTTIFQMVQRSPILREWIIPHALIMRNINRPGYQKYICCDKLLWCIIIVFFSLHETCSKDSHHFLDYRNGSTWLCEVFCVRQCNRLPNQKCGAPKKPCWGQPCGVWKGDCWLLKIQVMLLLKN